MRDDVAGAGSQVEDAGRSRARRGRSPDVAAVLAVLVPGLGHVYAGRVRAGLLWLLAVGVGYWAIFLPGAVLHAISIWSAYRAAEAVGGRSG